MKSSFKKWLIGPITWWRIPVSLLSIYLLLLLVAVFFADRFMFLPPESSYDETLPGLRFIDSPATDPLPVFYLPAAAGHPTLLWSHGNAEDIGQTVNFLSALHQSGLGVLAYEFPGYGLAAGRPTETSVNEASLAAYHFLTQSQAIEPGDIVLGGRSIGSGPTCWLASKQLHRRVVLISPLYSVYHTAFGFSPFPRNRFKNSQALQNSHQPLLVIHGQKDEIIPFHHAKRLFDEAPSSDKHLLAIPEAGHNDLFQQAGAAVLLAIQTFVDPSTL